MAGNKITIVEPESGAILVTTSLPGRPRWAVYDPTADRLPDAIWFNEAADHVYVAIGDPGLLKVFDPQELAVIQTIEPGLGTQTTAFDSGRQKLFAFRPTTCSALAYSID